MSKKPVKVVCTTCGSEDVTLEGWIVWNKHAQAHEVTDLCDKGHHCNTCDGMCRIEEVELTPEEIEALDLASEAERA